MTERPDLPRSLTSTVGRAAALWPDRTGWRTDLGDGADEALTFAEIAHRVDRLAGALHAAGVRAGDRIGLMLPNGSAFPAVWLALARLGAVTVPLHVRYQRVDAQHAVHLSGAHTVVTDAANAQRLADLPAAPRVLLVDELHGAHVGGAPAHDVDEEAVVNVQMTSGTTGRPKGCLLTHTYWTTLAGSLVTGFPRLRADDVMLTAQPFSYVDPQWNVVAGLLSGAELVILDGFHPSTFWSRVRAHRVTYFYCLAAMPTLLLRAAPDPADRDHRVRAVQCSAIPPGLHAGLEERWGVPWYEAFGMTETGADIRVDDQHHDALVGSGSIGRPAGHRKARIATDGELLLRGPAMMRGYLDDEHATARAFAGGWFHTGDLAREDAAGNLYLVGRLKDMIRRGGENIAAREVEEVLLTHPAVRLTAVVGVPDEIRGEEVRAYVVADDTSADDLAAYCADRLAGFKIPRFWSFHADLPRTPSERVEKSKLAALEGDITEVAR